MRCINNDARQQARLINRTVLVSLLLVGAGGCSVTTEHTPYPTKYQEAIVAFKDNQAEAPDNCSVTSKYSEKYTTVLDAAKRSFAMMDIMLSEVDEKNGYILGTRSQKGRLNINDTVKRWFYKVEFNKTSNHQVAVTIFSKVQQRCYTSDTGAGMHIITMGMSKLMIDEKGDNKTCIEVTSQVNWSTGYNNDLATLERFHTTLSRNLLVK